MIELFNDESNEIGYTIQVDNSDNSIEHVTWNNISEAWILVDKETVPNPANNTKIALSNDIEELLKHKKLTLTS